MSFLVLDKKLMVAKSKLQLDKSPMTFTNEN